MDDVNGTQSLEASLGGETWTLVSVSHDRGGGGEVVVVETNRRTLLEKVLGLNGRKAKSTFLKSDGEWRRLPSLERCRDDVQATLSGLLAAHRLARTQPPHGTPPADAQGRR